MIEWNKKVIAILVGIAGIIITVALHTVLTNILFSLLVTYATPAFERHGSGAGPWIIGLSAGFLAGKHFFDILLWAIAYRSFAGELQLTDFETALYFSAVTYTSLGYGDIVLTGPWRVICGIQAMNGILLFGWSTAILFLLLQRMWDMDQGDQAEK